MSKYDQRGVSAHKEEVLKATAGLDKGLHPLAFCKVYPDLLGQDPAMANVMHADGAGTKSILAYLYWKETGDLSVWKGIARDAIVMNLDDLLCVGVHDSIVFNSTIDRNKQLIPGDVLDALISGAADYFDLLARHGVNITYLGGETADVGDVVRTIAVNGTMTARVNRKRLVTNERIAAGDVVVGLASFGQSVYEDDYNSGIGSNGLTSARHDLLAHHYAKAFPETFDPGLSPDVVYNGAYRLTDIPPEEQGRYANIGRMILSPTRTYAPLMAVLLREHFDQIHGLIHCSGGGQTKCRKYLPAGTAVVKDALFDPPLIFRLIRAGSGCSAREMYEVFNMGCRMEIYCDPRHADGFIRQAEAFGIEARVIGRVVKSEQPAVTILHPEGTEVY